MDECICSIWILIHWLHTLLMNCIEERLKWKTIKLEYWSDKVLTIVQQDVCWWVARWESPRSRPEWPCPSSSCSLARDRDSRRLSWFRGAFWKTQNRTSPSLNSFFSDSKLRLSFHKQKDPREIEVLSPEDIVDSRLRGCTSIEDFVQTEFAVESGKNE